MAIVKPFCCIRPAKDAAARVAALPYDVYSEEEAKKEVEREPLSFLKIDRAETQFDGAGPYETRVYEKARETLDRMIEDGTFMMEEEPCYYLYELTMGEHIQTGIAACSSVDDYLNGVVKKHENTREEKEQDRIRHVDVTNAQTGPIFLAYRASEALKKAEQTAKQGAPLYDFVSPDGIRHRVFRISDSREVADITEAFGKIPCTYIADGHHRAASAAAVALKRRKECPEDRGNREYDYFLSVLFPDDELQILPYNRAVRDLNGLTEAEFLDRVLKHFDVSVSRNQAGGVAPGEKGTFGMYLGGVWYELQAKRDIRRTEPVKGLDVSLLQDHILGPVLGIADPRTDKRIEFIGGIKGVKELERRVQAGMAVAFSMYPTSMEELLRVADEGLLMPPKSTWFEPKLRSGLFIHRLG